MIEALLGARAWFLQGSQFNGGEWTMLYLGLALIWPMIRLPLGYEGSPGAGPRCLMTSDVVLYVGAALVLAMMLLSG